MKRLGKAIRIISGIGNGLIYALAYVRWGQTCSGSTLICALFLSAILIIDIFYDWNKILGLK